MSPTHADTRAAARGARYTRTGVRGTRWPGRWAMWGVAVAAALALGAGCGGGGKKGSSGPSGVVDDDDDEFESGGGGDDDVLISAEKLDEIQAFFDRKRRTVARCYEEMKTRVKRARVLVTMTIQPSGKLTNVKAAEVVPESDELESCVLDLVNRWTLPKLPKALDYSYAYSFEGL